MVTFKQLGDSLPHSYTEEQYQQCVDFFKNRKDDFALAANYLIVAEKSSAERLNRVCHAGIENGANLNNVKLVASHLNINVQYDARAGRMFPAKPSKAMLAYAHWLLNDSHFAHLIVNKAEHRTVEWLLDSGGFIVSAELPQPVLQMMMILSRSFGERMQPQFDKWFELVNKGLDPHAAYNLTMCVASGELAPNLGVNPRLGHTAMYLLDLDCMTTFVKGDLGELFDKTPYRARYSIYGCDRIFGQQTMTQDMWFVGQLFERDKDFCDVINKFRNGDASLENYRPPNPFAAGFSSAALRVKQVTYQELYEVVVPYIIEKGLFKP